MFETVDRMCLRVGALLQEARELNPSGFRRWVDERMPFGYDKAQRLIAIHLAYSSLPAETVAQLPRPWQAMYTLRRWTGGRLEEALESGEIGPDTTVNEARKKAREWSKNQRPRDPLTARYSQADLRAGALMEHPASELNPTVREALVRWLGSA